MSVFMIGLGLASLTGAAATLLLRALRRHLVLRFGGTWYYYLWLPVLLLFLLGFRVQIPFFPQAALSENTQQKPQIDLEADRQAPGADIVEPISQQAARRAVIPLPSIAEVLFLLWLAGVLASCARYGIGYARFARSITDREAAYHARGMDIYITARVHSPVQFGFFRPKLAMPDIEPDQETLDLILRHEAIHCRRKDLWVKLAATFICSLHWFNPAAHLMVRTMSETCEYACDEAVLETLSPEEKQTYAQTILQVAAQRVPALAMGLGSSAKQLKRRFIFMHSPIHKTRKTAASVAAFLALALLFSAFHFVLADGGTLTEQNGGVTTYYNISLPLEDNIKTTFREPTGGAMTAFVTSTWYIDKDAKRVDYFNRTEPVYRVSTGWQRKGTDLSGAQQRTVSMDGREVPVAFLSDTAAYADDAILWKLVENQIRFELTYQSSYADYDHAAFISALLDQGVYVFREVIPAGQFPPEIHSVQPDGGVIELRTLTHFDEKQETAALWNGKTWLRTNVDGRQGVQLGGEITVLAGHTLAVDVTETTDEMPTVNISIWDADSNELVDWIPNLLSGNRYAYTPGPQDAGHRFRVIVSTEENSGGLAGFHAFTFSD